MAVTTDELPLTCRPTAQLIVSNLAAQCQNEDESQPRIFKLQPEEAK